MPNFLLIRLAKFSSAYLCALLCVTSAHAEMDSRFKINPQALIGVKSDTPSAKTVIKPLPRLPLEQPVKQTIRQTDSTRGRGVVYTVQPGDHMYKILRRDYGLTTHEAWQFMKEIRRENNISDFEVIKAGRKIVIPPFKRCSDGTPVTTQAVTTTRQRAETDASVKQVFKLESPVAIFEKEAVNDVQTMWNQLVPSTPLQQKPLALQTSTFSLTIEPEHYPMFARIDGGRIVLDQNGTIPTLVKALVESKDSSVRIVSEEPSASKHFMASLLNAAGFYSVEENFSMDYGVDPKLTMQFDFKVEKTAESLITQDVALVNSGRTILSPILGEFLKKQGFSLHEPFASLKPVNQHDSRTIYSVSSKKQSEVIDSILNAFSVSPERNRRVDVFSAGNNGFSLSVNTELFFERDGQRIVVTSFDGDPINYTLFRILETKGYSVVILEAADDFRKISEKLISRMKIKGAFAHHDLLKDRTSGYSLQMSGFKLDDTKLPTGGIFLTDRSMDAIVRDLFIENGFTIKSR
jgi:LysM repeat protein